MAGPLSGSYDHEEMARIQSPVGDVRIVYSTSNYVLNTLTLKQSAFSHVKQVLNFARERQCRKCPVSMINK